MMIKYLFSFKGRVDRLGFLGRNISLIGLIILIFIAMVFLNAFGTSKLISGVFIFAIFLAAIIGGLSISVRRLHDIGLSGWWLLLYSVLYIALFVFGELSPALQDEQILANIENIEASEYFQNLSGPTVIGLYGINIVVSLFFLFWPGTRGENKYDD